ncbi:hypothetical protein [Roseiflexus sp.]|uniref:hypothetical protein n=1 Tax=Roseiflexus sp. TaxID=2562120 RepID=UPI00398AC987
MRFSRSVPILIITVLTAACVLTGALAIALRPRTITSHADAIAVVLEQRGIAHERIVTAQVWPAAVNYYAYGPSVYPYSATVSVTLPDGDIALGSLECADDRRRCRVSIARFGIDREPIPDISALRPLPWMAWVQRLIELVQQ